MGGISGYNIGSARCIRQHDVGSRKAVVALGWGETEQVFRSRFLRSTNCRAASEL
jgi:hypothetical protein